MKEINFIGIQISSGQITKLSKLDNFDGFLEETTEKPLKITENH